MTTSTTTAPPSKPEPQRSPAEDARYHLAMANWLDPVRYPETVRNHRLNYKWAMYDVRINFAL